jgi:hypothetical protein
LASNPTRAQGTSDPGLYAEERYGDFSYAIPVAEGRYAVTIFFDETYFGPGDPGKGGVGSRVFNVDCSGVALLRNFDIFKEVGAIIAPSWERFTTFSPMPRETHDFIRPRKELRFSASHRNCR